VPDDLSALADDYYDFRLRIGPSLGHLMGDYTYADRVERFSREAEDAEIEERREFARRAEAIPETGLDHQDRITREMLAFDATVEADLVESRLAELAVDPIGGPQAFLPVLIPKFTIPSAQVAEAMVAKFHGIGTAIRELGERHREGVANGRTPAIFAVEQVVAQLDEWLAKPVAEDPLLAVAEPNGAADPDAWRARLREIVEEEARPAIAAYRDVVRDEVGPHARSNDRPGLGWLPDGRQAYERAIRYYTTLARTSDEIHEIGIQHVDRLAGEYRNLGQEVLGTSDLSTIFERLRSDASLHHERGEDIVVACKAALARAKSAMGDWFGILPKADCDVEETSFGAIAYYFPPAQDGSRDGVFFMNTSDPQGWSRYAIEATVYHEGIPGHHLQLAISTELEGVPEFRKRAFISAYAEGWGLYSERLADEMGLYSGPLERIGMLSADSMRACRLVVDTGLHARGWTRDQAIAYMVANSPMREGHVAAEIDRYISTPGQALAYMLGRIEIQRIRREAESTLGNRFDIKAFHDTVLGSGLMPLPTLDRLVREWAEAA
jgi:uncharacterized protein (DUF885 family)